MRRVTIGGLAKACAVGVETIRYYQRRGLLAQPARTTGEVRRYGAEDAARLRFIRRAQDAGFSLDEVAALLKLGEVPDCRGARELAAGKLQAIDARLRDLRRIRRALSHLIEQCDAGAARSCPIIERFAGPVREPSSRV